MDIRDSIYKIVCELTGLDRSRLDLSTDLADDLGISELVIVRIMLDLEQRFNIAIPDEVISDLKTVSEMEQYVLRHLPADHIFEK